MRTSLICQWMWSRTPPSHTVSGSVRLQPAAAGCLHLKLVKVVSLFLSFLHRGFSNTETLCSEYKYYCEQCRSKQEAQKRLNRVISSLFYFVLSRISPNFAVHFAAGAGGCWVSIEKKFMIMVLHRHTRMLHTCTIWSERIMRI